MLLAGVRPDTLRALQNVGFESWFPAEQVFREEDEEYSATIKAVRYAHLKLQASGVAPAGEAAHTDDAEPHRKLYYLV